MEDKEFTSLIEKEASPELKPIPDEEIILNPRQALIETLGGGNNKKYIRFTMAALGSIPWFGSLLTATANLSGAISDFGGEGQQDKINQLLALWVEEHRGKIDKLLNTLGDIFLRFENFGDEIKNRVESPEYLNLVKLSFRSWDQADTEEKRQMFKRLIINAGATTLCEDDLVRLFINWIEIYHEAHFMVVKEIFQNPGISRGAIWDNIYGERPSDNSSKAGLFGYLIRQLTLGGVIHQQVEANEYGQTLKKPRPKHNSPSSNIKKSYFDETEPYVLTELGKEFVHYVMKDAAIQIGD